MISSWRTWDALMREPVVPATRAEHLDALRELSVGAMEARIQRRIARDVRGVPIKDAATRAAVAVVLRVVIGCARVSPGV